MGPRGLSPGSEIINGVLKLGLKEERQHIFNDWADALLNKDWESCDTCTMLLLHTLSSTSNHRKTLERWIDKVKTTYKQEETTLQNLINAQNNPFQREELKKRKPELDEWRANEIHNKFFGLFSKESLIEREN